MLTRIQATYTAWILGPWAHHETRETRDPVLLKEHVEKGVAINKALPIDTEQRVAFAPNVPPPITRKHHARIVVDMTSENVLAPISSEYKYPFWTFNGKTPGPFIRARVGDMLEVHHTNLDIDGIAHNVDFHGVAGPGGGAASTLAEKNETKIAVFKLTQPGKHVALRFFFSTYHFQASLSITALQLQFRCTSPTACMGCCSSSPRKVSRPSTRSST
jgi:hypothetical protein